MTRLEEIRTGTSVRGISPKGLARVVGVEWYGDQAIKVFYEDGDGAPHSRVLLRNEEPSLEVASSEGPWSFDGDGALLRLVSEADRIRLAHLFDPYLAVHTSRIEPLPHLSFEDERLPGEIYLPVGIFDDPETFEPDKHDWVSRRLRWFDVPDGLPRHEESSILR
jgi:hypothetical protein